MSTPAPPPSLPSTTQPPFANAHIDDDTPLEDTVGPLRHYVPLLLQARRALRLVLNSGVYVLPLTAGRQGRCVDVAVRAPCHEVDLMKPRDPRERTNERTNENEPTGR